MGKAYANRKPLDQRPEADFYSTPYCLTWKLLELNQFDPYLETYEPACGNGAISSQLKKHGFIKVIEDDIRLTKKDFLNCKEHYPQIITNPPFSLFDEFVIKAKECSNKFAFIFKTNFFGAHSRYKNGIWDNLKSVYIFDRQIDYRSPLRDDGKVHCGNLITGWGIWDSTWDKDYWTTKVISIQDYCKLGGIK